MNDAYRRERLEADNDRLRAEVGRLRSVLEDLAETGGWRTEWVADEADGSRGPSTWNETKDLARAALAEGAPVEWP